jgi:hypothetical protein
MYYRGKREESYISSNTVESGAFITVDKESKNPDV